MNEREMTPQQRLEFYREHARSMAAVHGQPVLLIEYDWPRRAALRLVLESQANEWQKANWKERYEPPHDEPEETRT